MKALIRLIWVFTVERPFTNQCFLYNFKTIHILIGSYVLLKVAAHIKKGRDCRVTIDKKHVKVEYKDTSGGWTVAVNGDLTWDVHKDESVWSLVPGDHIHVSDSDLHN